MKVSLDHGGELVRLSQNDMTRVSRMTVIVAAGGPKSNAAAKTNVSETDSRAGMPGMRTVKEPLSKVRTPNISHFWSTGDRSSE